MPARIRPCSMNVTAAFNVSAIWDLIITTGRRRLYTNNKCI